MAGEVGKQSGIDSWWTETLLRLLWAYTSQEFIIVDLPAAYKLSTNNETESKNNSVMSQPFMKGAIRNSKFSTATEINILKHYERNVVFIEIIS